MSYYSDPISRNRMSGINELIDSDETPEKKNITGVKNTISTDLNLDKKGVGCTVVPSQPLNVIARDGLGNPSNISIHKEADELKDKQKKGDWETYTKLCDICQIKVITGTCDHCGIGVYGSDVYLTIPDQFDIKVRRRQ